MTEAKNSNIVIYTDLQGQTQIQVILEDETVWLTQAQMVAMFNKAKLIINEYINNIYNEQELKKRAFNKKIWNF